MWQKDPARQDAEKLWAASCLCFFGFFWSGEVVSLSEQTYDAQSHMCFDNIRVDNRSAPTFIQVQIKASKTDPFRHGVTVYIGATNGLLCPVAAVLSYMVDRGNTPGLLFKWADGRYLTREKFVVHVRLALSAAGLMATNYAGHSFLIGAATTAARCGIQDALIKMLRRWESLAYTRYIRTAPEVLCKMSHTLDLLSGIEPAHNS